jgi:hypothetical protein
VPRITVGAAHATHCGRTVLILRHVLFAIPSQLDRFALHCFRQVHRLQDVVGFGTSTESAAHDGVIAPDFTDEAIFGDTSAHCSYPGMDLMRDCAAAGAATARASAASVSARLIRSSI